MSDKPTENTYTVELISQIKQLDLGFDAAFEMKRQDKEGIKKPDVLLSYKGNLVAVIEVKDPSIPLSDPKLNEQARKYAESWYKDKGAIFYGTHNIKYLKLFKHVGKKGAKLDEYLDLRETDWVPLTDFPFPIITWAKSIEDYKEISSNRIARDNLAKFLLKFKNILEGKLIDLTEEAISKIGEIIEIGASSGMSQILYLYRNQITVKEDVEKWMKERGLEKPKNDAELLGYLNVLLKEQLYTFVMKSLFYYVLQSGFPDMASRLEQKLSDIRVSDPILFKKIFDELF